MSRVALERAIDDLREKHGSYRAAARVLRVDHVYLHRLRTGKRDNPSPAILRKLRLVRTVTVKYSKKEPTA